MRGRRRLKGRFGKMIKEENVEGKGTKGRVEEGV